MADIRDQMQQMAATYGRMRNWIVEVVAFEPVVKQAMQGLQPLLQLGNLRHMNPAELRQVIRTMNDRHELQYGGTPETAPETAAEKPAAEKPILESAQAN